MLYPFSMVSSHLSDTNYWEECALSVRDAGHANCVSMYIACIEQVVCNIIYIAQPPQSPSVVRFWPPPECISPATFPTPSSPPSHLRWPNYPSISDSVISVLCGAFDFAGGSHNPGIGHRVVRIFLRSLYLSGRANNPGVCDGIIRVRSLRYGIGRWRAWLALT